MLFESIRLHSAYNDRVVCVRCCPELGTSLDSLRIRVVTLVAILLKSLVDDRDLFNTAASEADSSALMLLEDERVVRPAV